jgi:amino acid permease
MYSFSISMLHPVALARCTHPGVPCLSVVCAHRMSVYIFYLPCWHADQIRGLFVWLVAGADLF